MGKTEAVPDEFATAMQQLSAEAEKTLPPDEMERHDHFGGEDNLGRVIQEFSALNDRIQTVENALSKRLDQLAAAMPPAKRVDRMCRVIRATISGSGSRASATNSPRRYKGCNVKKVTRGAALPL